VTAPPVDSASWPESMAAVIVITGNSHGSIRAVRCRTNLNDEEFRI
jgi:hypothetical protein